ncbi:MAG: alpha/beta hydrolase, partial [Verrucomicrobia bacterium]|nr:alpha/beta hydrolase [Verrucomicrobiota bacterium]
WGHGAGGFHRIAYTECGQPSAQPPVICVHGLIRNGRDFDYLARALEADGRQVFCPDIVGRGKSDWLANPANYNYAQYIADMAVLIARTGAESVDWVGTSMGGLIGMLLAAETNTPIRRLVINDVGPYMPLAALKRIAAYLESSPLFDDLEGVEKYLREIYAPFGDLSDENWGHLARYSTRAMPDNKLGLAYDPAIAQAFRAVNQDVDLWWTYDRVRCPVLVLHGLESDVLPTPTAQQMTQRGPRAQLVEFPKIGHAPALMDPAQIAIVAEFLRRESSELRDLASAA